MPSVAEDSENGTPPKAADSLRTWPASDPASIALDGLRAPRGLQQAADPDPEVAVSAGHRDVDDWAGDSAAGTAPRRRRPRPRRAPRTRSAARLPEVHSGAWRRRRASMIVDGRHWGVLVAAAGESQWPLTAADSARAAHRTYRQTVDQQRSRMGRCVSSWRSTTPVGRVEERHPDFNTRMTGVRKPRYTHPTARAALRRRPRRRAVRARWLTSPEMAGFGDAPLVGPGSELQLTIDGQVVPHAEVLADRDLELARARARARGRAGRGGGGARAAQLVRGGRAARGACGDAVDAAPVRGDLPLLRRLAARRARPTPGGR